MSRSLLGEAAGRRVKLAVVVDSHNVGQVRLAFSSWSEPRCGGRFRPQYRYKLSRRLNRSPGFLRLALHTELADGLLPRVRSPLGRLVIYRWFM